MPKSRDLVTAPVVIPPRATQVYKMPGTLETARANLTSEYFGDLYQAWRAKGQAVLETVAMLYPDTFLRVVASHMPRELHATVMNVQLERKSTAELESLLAASIADAGIDHPSPEGAKVIQQVDTPESV